MTTKKDFVEHAVADELSTTNYHIPVLFSETIDALQIKPNGIYVDCTFGGGGHSKAIIERLEKNGRLVAFDQDSDAISNIPVGENKLLFIPQNFKYIQRFLRLHKIDKVDGLLADLGVSSHQFDVGARGFSTRFDGPLDMRMDTREELTAAIVVANYSEKQLHKMFEQYGEVSNAKTLAKHIVDNRSSHKIETIDQFKSLIHAVVKGNPAKYLAQVFQAIRIEVNKEMEVLKELLKQLDEIVKVHGRVAIITFHSLEDRLVKNYFKYGDFELVADDNPFVQTIRQSNWQLINKKPITASKEELKKNPRSRSAKLRIVERL